MFRNFLICAHTFCKFAIIFHNTSLDSHMFQILFTCPFTFFNTFLSVATCFTLLQISKHIFCTFHMFGQSHFSSHFSHSSHDSTLDTLVTLIAHVPSYFPHFSCCCSGYQMSSHMFHSFHNASYFSRFHIIHMSFTFLSQFCHMSSHFLHITLTFSFTGITFFHVFHDIDFIV